MSKTLACLMLVALLAACSTDDSAPPSVTITSPAAGAPVSGTTTVQMSATDDKGVGGVELFVRGKGEENLESVGSANQAPYIVSWYTPAQPNFAELELVAVATDSGGNRSEFPAVAVKTQNSGVPNLQLVTAFTIEPDPTVSGASLSLYL